MVAGGLPLLLLLGDVLLIILGNKKNSPRIRGCCILSRPLNPFGSSPLEKKKSSETEKVSGVLTLFQSRWSGETEGTRKKTRDCGEMERWIL